MKKYNFILKAILILVIAVFYACPEPVDPDDPGNPNHPGDGSAKYPFKVANVADLKRVGTGLAGPSGLIWSADKNYKQIANIDLSSESYWTPICAGSSFGGVYDGDGYTISNLYIFGNDSNRGLFGEVNGKVSNVRLSDSDITGKQNVGGIVGRVDAQGIIDHCFVNNTNTYAEYQVGGVAGHIYVNGTVSNCMVIGGTVNGTGTFAVNGITGGVAGNNSGIIKNCYTTVNVSGNQNVGGIAGHNTGNGTVQNCYATGNISSKIYHVGGIAGNNGGKIQNCVALNREINKTSASSEDIGRIAGIEGGERLNNYARKDMTLMAGTNTVPATDATLTSIHGADVSAADYNGANSGKWWSSTAAFPASAWEFATNRLPHLLGFDGLTQNPTVIP
jgi:hypothetical protein